MSDLSILSLDPSEGGNVASTKSDNGFALANSPSKANTATGDKSTSVATWLERQTTAGTDSRGDRQGNVDSPNFSNINESKSSMASQAQNMSKSTPPNSATRDKTSAPAHRFIDGIDVSTMRHFVITVTNQQQNMPNKIWATIEHDYQRHGVAAMLHLILWANIYLIEDRENGFWKQVKRTASAKVPKDLNCEVLVKGDTEKVYRVFKSIDLLVHNKKHFFNGNSFYFSFREGEFFWRFYGDGPDLHSFLIEEGIPTVEKTFKRVSPMVPKPWYP